MSKAAVKKYAIVAVVAILANEVWVMSGARKKALSAAGVSY